MGMDKAKLLKLGIFIAAGLAVFIFGIFYIGSKENMFTKTFEVYSVFSSVSGLTEGNNVQFAGINVGTVKSISILATDKIKVTMSIQNKVREFIKKDSEASINSEGLVGNKVLLISGGTPGTTPVETGDSIHSIKPAELGDIITNLDKSSKEAQKIAEQITEITQKVNNGEGTLGKLVNNSDLYDHIDSLTSNVATSTKSIDKILAQTSSTITTVSRDIENLTVSLKLITDNIADITTKINSSQSLVGTLLTDTVFANNIKGVLRNTNQTTANLEMGSFSFYQNMEALKHNFLFKGYFEDLGYWDKTDFQNTMETRENRILDKEFELDKKEVQLRELQGRLELMRNELQRKLDSLKLNDETK
jgi:phospholipid/cholesterol/gamma-HCH transport system substrate-binding protein